MSKNLALEKVGRARLTYTLMKRGWKVGEAYDDGYDILAHHPVNNRTAFIELKTMDITNRTSAGNLTAPVTKTEQKRCTHIVIYVEPDGWYFIARKAEILTENGNVFAALNKQRQLRTPMTCSKSFAKFKDAWDELLK
ncbi:MAG: hypothetical protein ACOYM3_11495 [Terrimicrobiaceae bacterium]